MLLVSRHLSGVSLYHPRPLLSNARIRKARERRRAPSKLVNPHFGNNAPNYVFSPDKMPTYWLRDAP